MNVSLCCQQSSEFHFCEEMYLSTNSYTPHQNVWHGSKSVVTYVWFDQKFMMASVIHSSTVLKHVYIIFNLTYLLLVTLE